MERKEGRVGQIKFIVFLKREFDNFIALGTAISGLCSLRCNVILDNGIRNRVALREIYFFLLAREGYENSRKKMLSATTSVKNLAINRLIYVKVSENSLLTSLV